MKRPLKEHYELLGTHHGTICPLSAYSKDMEEYCDYLEAGGRKTPKELFFDYARRYPKDAYKTSPKLFCEFIR